MNSSMKKKIEENRGSRKKKIERNLHGSETKIILIKIVVGKKFKIFR